MLFLEEPVSLGQLGELGLDAGDPLSTALFRIGKVTAEALDLAAKLIPFDAELVRLTTEPVAFTLVDLVTFGERRLELYGLIQGTLPVHAQTVLLGSGGLQLLFAPLEQLRQNLDLGTSGVQVRVPPSFPFVNGVIQNRLFVADDSNLAPEPLGLGGQDGPFLHQGPDFRRCDPAERRADGFQLDRCVIERIEEPAVLILDLVEFSQEFLFLGRHGLVTGLEPVMLVADLTGLGSKPVDVGLEPIVRGFRAPGSRP